MDGISIVICCFNSETIISKTLEHLANQEYNEHLLWEIILVDNNSTDNTIATAKLCCRKHALHDKLSILAEPQQGLVYARKTGVENAKYEYVLFCDDDNHLAHDYVQRAFNRMESDSSIGVLGGRSQLLSDVDIPFWFSTYQQSFAIGVQGLDSGFELNHGFIWGAGMVIRKDLYAYCYNNEIDHILTGRVKGKTTSGDDVEINFWFRWAGYRLFYDENLVLLHFMPSQRLTKEYYKKLKEGFLNSEPALLKYSQIERFAKLRKSIVLRFFLFFISLIKYFIQRKKTDKILLQIFHFFPFWVFDEQTKKILSYYKKITDFSDAPKTL